MLNSPVDTLVCDTTQLTLWRSDAAYDYNRELVMPDMNLFEWLSRQVGELLRRLLGSRLVDNYSGLILFLCVTAILLTLIWFVYKKRPDLFMRSRRNKLAYTIEEDTIYGIDFEKAIAEALQQGCYKEGVRLVYLQTLKGLSDGQRIDWQLYKTPSQYLYEVKMGAFKQLTTDFLRVRYGNFEATASLVELMQSRQKEVIKGGEA